MFSCVVDKVPNNEEVLHIAHAFDGLEFIFQTIQKFLIQLSVTFLGALHAQFSQIFLGGLSSGNLIIRNVDLAESQFHIALVRNDLGVFNGFRNVRKQISHFPFRLQIELVIREAHSVFVFHQLTGLNTNQNVMSLGITLTNVMHVIGGHQRNSCFCSQSLHIGKNFQLFFQALILQFQIEVSFAKNVQKCQRFGLSSFVVIIHQQLLDLTCQATAQGNDPFAILTQNIMVHTRLIVESASKSLGYDLHQIFIALFVLCQKDQMALMLIELWCLIGHLSSRRIDFTTQNGLYTLFLTFFIEINDAEHNAVIGDGTSFHPLFLDFFDQIFDSSRAIQKAIFCMNM